MSGGHFDYNGELSGLILPLKLIRPIVGFTHQFLFDHANYLKFSNVRKPLRSPQANCTG